MAAVTLLQKWQLLQAIIADIELSPSAKLVATRLLYHHSAQTGRCSPSYQTLAEGTSLTRRSVITGVRELEEGGWVLVQRVKGGDPTAARGFVTNAFAIAFDRLEALPQAGEGVKETTLPRVKKTTLNSGKDTGKGNREGSPPTPSDFDEWWRAYPRKVGKDAAQPVFIRITKARKATVAELIEGAKRYAAERAEQDPQFTKHPKTWLNGGHWADEAEPKPLPHANGRQPFSALGRLQENMYDDD